MQTCRLACVRLIWLTRSEMCSGREPAPLSKNDPVTCDALAVFYYSNAIMLLCLARRRIHLREISQRLFYFRLQTSFLVSTPKKTRPPSTKDGDDHGEQPRTSTLNPIYLSMIVVLIVKTES